MNNENNNNLTGEDTNQNQNLGNYTNPNQNLGNNNMDSNVEQDSQQSYNSCCYSGNFNSYYTESQSNTINSKELTDEPTPEVIKESKPKKKRKLFGVFKLTVAAVAFGLIAGVVFQGYYMVAWPESSKGSDISKNDNLQITEVTQDSKSGDTIVPTSTSKDSVITDVSDVVANVMPSIVAINSAATITNYDFFGRGYNEDVQGSGSGIIIGQNGSEILIVTNNHVIQDATSIEIVFADETTATAVVKGADANADLAVLSVDLDQLTDETAGAIKVATLGDSNAAKAGEMAIAIGNALGYGQSVTVGYISAVNREVTIEDQTMTLLQTDAAINPGNSGGALINSTGQVIGINSVKFASEEVEGMGYAIPISSALPMINELMNREVVAAGEQGFLGIDTSTAQDVTDVYATRFNMPKGVYVNDVVAGSPAETAGLMQGDIITGIDETTIETIDELISALSYKKAGQTIDLIIQVKENGAYVEKTLTVILGERE